MPVRNIVLAMSAKAANRGRDSHESLLSGLGKAVRARRTELALTLRELAEVGGLSERFLAELEAGRGNISIARLHDVAVGLGTTASALLAEVEAEAPLKTVIALLGLRGAGKSTIGARLAKKLGVPFFELDELVESAAGVSLGELFELHGEAFYRRLEREALQRILAAHASPAKGAAGAVIATGGSIVNDEETWAMLRANTRTVWLQASPESHWARVVAQGDRRPMANRADAESELRAILRQRADRYARADLAVNTDAVDVEGAVKTITRAARGVPRRAS
jgi:XRE family aerobic/anaerobic benzoate catabolism transcriptional regulator